ncbi:hypothetical protein WJX72_011853 [[Myrmecia] bisecta]|uniref:DNA 3'-5' helicase n=1 Tax=[Myrmecia] bisecta TaxID=41462 RepID=A0AAW1PPX0_9CHLO
MPNQEAHGVLVKYGPGQAHTAFLEGDSSRHFVMVGGLTNGLLFAPYYEGLAGKLKTREWTVVQPILSSSYTGWGVGSLDQDAHELLLLTCYLKEHRGCTDIIMLGFSTGCQDVVRYVQRSVASEDLPRLRAAILQAPVSDREYLAMSPDTPQLLKQAEALIAQGRGEDIVCRPAALESAPVCARRLQSLAGKGGDDDMFSSDLTDAELQELLGHMAGTPTLVVISGADECLPPHVNGVALGKRLASAIGPSAQSTQDSYLPPEAPSDSDCLRSVQDLPACFRPVFASSFRYFNPVQSECYPSAFGSDLSMVVAAPTGSGKTGVMELAILRLMSRYIKEAGDFCLKPGSLKVIYLAPIRALVQEKAQEWSVKFGERLGLSCKEMTGDSDAQDLQGMDAADIICTTPEKFDAVTRKHKDQGGMRFFGEVALVLIDEVHLLSENRGSALEAGAISRIKMVSKFADMRELPLAKVRFVAVSATIPNIADIGTWLEVPPQNLKVFGEEMRPVRLKVVVRGYNPTKNDFLFERRLNNYISTILAENSKGKPSLIFCSSRKGTTDTAAHLLNLISRQGGQSPYISNSAQYSRLQQAAERVTSKQLQQVLRVGLGFHNAAMESQDRAVVEALFRERDILVLCTTSTLAVGVNLPAHLVVLKGTRRWTSELNEAAGYKEYDRSTCLQMIGRAGRPQYDTEGVAVIMTQKQMVHRYENLASGSELVESQLKGCFAEYLNAEIALRTITDVSMSITWLKSTFLYLRVKKNPGAYGMAALSKVASAAEADKMLQDKLIMATVEVLAKYGLVQTDECGFVLDSQVPGRLMAHHYIRLPTMINIVNVPDHASMPDLLDLIARSDEFSGIKLRRDQKKILNAINKGQGVRFSVTDPAKPQKAKERISTAADKIFILINEALSDRPADTLDFSMKQELEQVLKVGQRIAACMAKYFAHRQQLTATANSLMLTKCLKQRLWENSVQQCRQLRSITRPMAARLLDAGVTSLQQLNATDARRIETVTQQRYPAGSNILHELRATLPPRLQLELLPQGRMSSGRLEMELVLTRVEDPSSAGGERKNYAKLVAGSLHNDALLVHESIVLENFQSPYRVRFVTKTPASGGAAVEVVASVIHDRLVPWTIATSRHQARKCRA